VKDLGGGDRRLFSRAFDVKRGLLVRIFAVAKVIFLAEGEGNPAREITPPTLLR
jgi:hypothetical protein